MRTWSLFAASTRRSTERMWRRCLNVSTPTACGGRPRADDLEVESVRGHDAIAARFADMDASVKLRVHMRRVLQTDFGSALYRRRQAMIEPVFGHTKFNRRIDRFQRRGRSAVRAEWRLIAATHNLLKLHRHQIAAAAA